MKFPTLVIFFPSLQKRTYACYYFPGNTNKKNSHACYYIPIITKNSHACYYYPTLTKKIPTPVTFLPSLQKKFPCLLLFSHNNKKFPQMLLFSHYNKKFPRLLFFSHHCNNRKNFPRLLPFFPRMCVFFAQEDRLDPMIYVFPRMTKCTFHKFGTSGEVRKSVFFSSLFFLSKNCIFFTVSVQ